VCGALGDRATVRMFADADHSFHVPARTGRTDPQVHRLELGRQREIVARPLQEPPAANRRVGYRQSGPRIPDKAAGKRGS
jgi:hypothetical protein